MFGLPPPRVSLMVTSLDLFDISDRTAIVTGGAGFLGEQFCRALAGAGAQVVVADQDVAKAKTIALSIEAREGKALAVEVDVRQMESVRAMVQKTQETFGQLDILVNSAALDPKFDPEHAGKHSNAFEDYPLDAWNEALAVNLTGPMLCAQVAAEAMRRHENGVIINVCSIYGLVGPDQRLHQREDQPAQYKPVTYTVTKAGVLGLTKYLATYYGEKGIRVNALTPGGIFNDHADDFVKAYSARAVLGRMAEKEEMNGALLFLASDASRYMTGANLIVDGGWTAW